MVERQATINASPEVVWKMFSDMDQWIVWDPDLVSIANIDRGLVDGGGMTAKFKTGFQGRITFSEVKEHESFVWQVRALGGLIRAYSTFQLEAVDDGTATHLTYAFEMKGLLGSLISTLMPQEIVHGTEEGLANIKKLCEA